MGSILIPVKRKVLLPLLLLSKWWRNPRVMYVWLEKYFSRGDYRRRPTPEA